MCRYWIHVLFVVHLYVYYGGGCWFMICYVFSVLVCAVSFVLCLAVISSGLSMLLVLLYRRAFELYVYVWCFMMCV